jgi:hypothetical protein
MAFAEHNLDAFPLDQKRVSQDFPPGSSLARSDSDRSGSPPTRLLSSHAATRSHDDAPTITPRTKPTSNITIVFFSAVISVGEIVRLLNWSEGAAQAITEVKTARIDFSSTGWNI